MKQIFAGLLLFLLASLSAQAELVEKTIDYQAGDTKLVGYIVYSDEFEGKRPGVLVVHEWWGHNEYARERARMLALMGYTAMALDMYGDGKQAEHPEDASRFSTAIRQNSELAQQRFLAARDVLIQQETVDPDKLAAIGYCFGGSVVLDMARNGIDLQGVVSFHGGLTTQHPAEEGKVTPKVLVFNGDDDPMVTPDQIKDFKSEMTKANVSYDFVSYPGAKHGFTNPEADDYGQKFNLPLEYNALADIKSWMAMTTFFTSLFGPR